MLLLFIALLICAVGSVIFYLSMSRRQREHEKCITAARNIVQEDILDYAMKNPHHSSALPPPAPRRQMIFLRVNTTPPRRLVFDPGKGINIGRDTSACQIQLQDPRTSQRHCRIYAQNSTVILQDLGSENGTILCRGLFHKYLLRRGQSLALRSSDTICVGSVRLRVKLFIFDDMTM